MSFISLVPLLWTPWTKLISLLRYGLHTWHQYSQCGLTRLLYSGMTVSLDLSWKFLFIRHLEDNHLITDSQHGFRKGRSCLTNLLEFLDKVTGCIDIRERLYWYRGKMLILWFWTLLKPLIRSLIKDWFWKCIATASKVKLLIGLLSG